MCKYLGLLILLIPLVSADAATDDSAAQELLITAERQASLFHDQGSPFELNVDFTAQLNVPTPGKLTLKWAAADRWWRKIVLGTFEQIDVRNGEKLATTRNISFTPISVRELVDLVQFAEGSDQLVARKPKPRAENGVQMICLEVQQKASKRKSHEVCIDSLTHDLLSDQWQESPDERPRARYGDYFEFGSHRYPRHLELRQNGSRRVDANVQSLIAYTFDENLLVPPQGAIERRQCVDMKAAAPLRPQPPLYPGSVGESPAAGETMVAMTVLADGSVTDVHVIGSSLRSLDAIALNTVKTWRFRPATCGTEPIVSDIEAIVRFGAR